MLHARKREMDRPVYRIPWNPVYIGWTFVKARVLSSDRPSAGRAGCWTSCAINFMGRRARTSLVGISVRCHRQIWLMRYVHRKISEMFNQDGRRVVRPQEVGRVLLYRKSTVAELYARAEHGAHEYAGCRDLRILCNMDYRDYDGACSLKYRVGRYRCNVERERERERERDKEREGEIRQSHKTETLQHCRLREYHDLRMEDPPYDIFCRHPKNCSIFCFSRPANEIRCGLYVTLQRLRDRYPAQSHEVHSTIAVCTRRFAETDVAHVSKIMWGTARLCYQDKNSRYR